MRYRLTLSYDGSAFCGWQVQPDAPSVQGAIQEKLSMLLGSPTEIVGAGRTDTGVHASYYVAHFDSSSDFDPEQLKFRLNAVLPHQIAVSGIARVSDGFHARFSAVSRQYKYYIHQEKDPFRDAYSWYCRFNLDLDRMNRACGFLIGTHDCRCFEKTGSDNPSSVCEIKHAGWEQRPPFPPAGVCPGSTEGGEAASIVFTIEANRFLRNMVRAIVGTMVDIGRGVHEPEWVLELLDKGTRGDAGQSVPGHALFLSDIRY